MLTDVQNVENLEKKNGRCVWRRRSIIHERKWLESSHILALHVFTINVRADWSRRTDSLNVAAYIFFGFKYETNQKGKETNGWCEKRPLCAIRKLIKQRLNNNIKEEEKRRRNEYNKNALSKKGRKKPQDEGLS